MALGVIVVALTLGTLLDWWLNLPVLVRAVFLAIDVALVGYVLARYWLGPVWNGPDDDQIALLVEEAQPRFSTRLIASVQFTRARTVPAGASVSLVRAMIAQAESIANAVDFPAVIKTDRLMRTVIGSILLLVGGLALYSWGARDSVSTDLLKRAFLVPGVEVPRDTHVSFDGINPDMVVARGDTVVLQARARGVVPPSGQVQISGGGVGGDQKFTLDESKTQPSLFSRSMDNVQDSFRYRITLNDGQSGWHTVKVLARPVTTRIDARQSFPAYTGMGVVGRSLGDLSILSGSHLLLRITASQPCMPTEANHFRHSFIHVTGVEKDIDMDVDPASPLVLSGDFEVDDKATGFSVNLVDRDGMTSKDPALYRIDVIQDHDPVVKVSFPVEREELVTKMATILIKYDASDDFGIAGAALRYKIDDGDAQTLDLGAILPGKPLPRVLAAKAFEWRLASLPPPPGKASLEGSTIEYWLEVTDNNDVRKSGPGVGASDHFAARVVSEAEKRAEITARMNGQIDGIRSDIDAQQKLSDDLGGKITGGSRK
jgi:hypothetical protein